jgi:L-asparaginase II
VTGGAEGLACAALVERGLGVAVKVRDGGRRAVPPALIRALELLEAVGAKEAEALARFARPPVTGGGRAVGELAVQLELVRP